MNDITLSLSAAEALFAHGELEKAAATAYTRWRRLVVTNAPADEQDAAKVAAEHLDRVCLKIADELYPACDWLEDCDRPVVDQHRGRPYCQYHLELFGAAVPA